MVLTYAHVSAGGYYNNIIAVRDEKNECDTTRFFLINNNQAGVDLVCLQRAEELLAKRIVANSSAHSDRCAKTCHCYSLVCSLSTRSKFKRASPKECFAQYGDVRNTYNLVHIETTNNENITLRHFSILSWFYRKHTIKRSTLSLAVRDDRIHAPAIGQQSLKMGQRFKRWSTPHHDKFTLSAGKCHVQASWIRQKLTERVFGSRRLGGRKGHNNHQAFTPLESIDGIDTHW